MSEDTVYNQCKKIIIIKINKLKGVYTTYTNIYFIWLNLLSVYVENIIIIILFYNTALFK